MSKSEGTKNYIIFGTGYIDDCDDVSHALAVLGEHDQGAIYIRSDLVSEMIEGLNRAKNVMEESVTDAHLPIVYRQEADRIKIILDKTV